MLPYPRRPSFDDKTSPRLDDAIPQLAWSDEGAAGGGSGSTDIAWTDTSASEAPALVDFGPEAAKKGSVGGGKSSGGTTSPSGSGGTTSGGGTGSASSTTSPMTGSSFTPLTVQWTPLNPPS